MSLKATIAVTVLNDKGKTFHTLAGDREWAVLFQHV